MTEKQKKNIKKFYPVQPMQPMMVPVYAQPLAYPNKMMGQAQPIYQMAPVIQPVPRTVQQPIMAVPVRTPYAVPQPVTTPVIMAQPVISPQPVVKPVVVQKQEPQRPKTIIIKKYYKEEDDCCIVF